MRFTEVCKHITARQSTNPRGKKDKNPGEIMVDSEEEKVKKESAQQQRPAHSHVSDASPKQRPSPAPRLQS
jgi:hypothetical protein